METIENHPLRTASGTGAGHAVPSLVPPPDQCLRPEFSRWLRARLMAEAADRIAAKTIQR
jgi:hypothetical protein